MKRWHSGVGWRVTENEDQIAAFIKDILKVCKEHNMSITTNSPSCNLLIEPYDDIYASDLHFADVDFRTK